MDVKIDGDSIQWGLEQWCPEHITTGVAAEFCGVSKVTVLRRIQRGYLTAFRLPDGHYRIRREDFASFLLEHGMPVTRAAAAHGHRGGG